MNEYRIKNKEVISQRKKDYRERNKEVLAEKKKVKVHCDVCDIDVTKVHIRRHERSKIHIDNLNKCNN